MQGLNRKRIGKGLGLLLLAVLLSSCAVQFYPRPVSRQEKMESNYAHAFDNLGIWFLRTFLYKQTLDPARQKLELDSYMFYADPKFQDPKNFYPEPGAVPEMKKELVGEDREYRIYLVSWPSLYQPVNPDFQRLYDNYREDWTAYAIYYQHKQPCPAAIVHTHGWTGGDIRTKANQKANRLRELGDLGFDIMFVQQPYHGMRMPKGSAFSGDYFVSAELSQVNEATCQAVTDMRTAIKWLGQDHKLIGMHGGSLGGIVTLATAAAEPKLDFAVAWVPPSSWATMLSSSKLLQHIAQGVWNAGIGLDQAGKILYPSSPINYQPAIPKDDILIVAGMGDNFVPPAQEITLWEKWGKPQIYWYPGGHVLVYGRGQEWKVEKAFLARQLEKLAK
jgi:dienelactone hydrolase